MVRSIASVGLPLLETLAQRTRDELRERGLSVEFVAARSIES